ncbi:hypothetical protein DL98DRAFT_544883 [Cadophora sp. DSE1049]|nr:hypothetical protein DL98DRAFT_544883 [Cadophora sp. DSE1049]
MEPDAPEEFPLEYIIDHVFLPPKLPTESDTTFEIEAVLTDLVHDTLKKFIDILPQDDNARQWKRLPPMLSILLEADQQESPILKLGEKIGVMSEGDVLALQITQQNAGLVIRKQAHTYSFETFELSASSRAVTTTIGRLVRRFPGLIIAVEDERVRDRNFRRHFTNCLRTLDSETLDNTLSHPVGAFRDSVHPQFATEWLPGILRGIGSPLKVSRIFKRTRDEVLWGDGSEPWRRSPRWMLIRLAIQTTLAEGDENHTRYKMFMIYFMARVVELAVQDEFISDKLHIMLAKINRRIQKLGPIINDIPWGDQAQDYVLETMKSARSLINKRWHSIQRLSNSAGGFHLAHLRMLKPHADTPLRLSKLKPYLGQLHIAAFEKRAEITFEGKCLPRITSPGSSLPDASLLKSPTTKDIQLSLMDLELWVATQLDSWLEQHIQSEKHLLKLAKLMHWYMRNSMLAFSGSPERFSVMVLTLMLLWVALDKAAVSRYPLLNKFDPAMPPTLCGSLFLPKRHQMDQLRKIETYILKRKTTSNNANPSVFGDISSPMSFGAQYFDQSNAHQVLKIHIEQEARDRKTLKKAELNKLRARYLRLTEEANRLTCEYVLIWVGRGRNKRQKEDHDPACQRCALTNEASGLRISCCEWPLPSSESTAKSVVFELDTPAVFRSWRSTTYQILADVLSAIPPPNTKPRGVILTEYEGLARHLKSKADRLQLASSTKPHVQTPRRSQLVRDASEETVCLPNALQFVMQDSNSQCAVREHLGKYNIHDRCTLKLPRGCYESLQYAVADTTHTPNDVVSLQGECPDGITVHEFHAFATLRSGNRIQWLNIARELVSRTLNFGSEEVHLLILQASCQAGPSSLQQVSRDSHTELEEEGFGLDLLSALEAGMASIESNWQGSTAALTFISLTTRLLSMSLYDSVRVRCLKLLQYARKVTIGWLRVVSKLLHETSDEEGIAYLTLRVLDLALICHSTFDIDPRQLPSLLSSTEVVTILIEAATTIDDRWPLLRRFERTSHTLESILREKIISGSEGLDKAVGRMWTDYKPGMPWTVVQEPNDRWVTTQSAESESASSMTVHYNTLTGSLLINGRPLSRLPFEYEKHPTYQRLFGNKILRVIPSNKKMYFQTRNTVHGFQVHFALNDTELIVRACHGQEIYEAIPLHALEDDFPCTLIDNFVHWCHRGTMEIEFRPLESKWMPSAGNWRISLPQEPNANLVLRSRRLVDPASNTAEIICKWLAPLESPSNISIFYNDETKETDIRLPRMNLDFILRDTGLESKQFRGMVVDTNQQIGTLHGLLHKLVLKEAEGRLRTVIVPHGTVSFHQLEKENRVSVSISTGPGDKVSYHRFDIDKTLGLLVDNGNLRSRLFRLYLHALTSHCLPDNLTGRTGTEEALHGLRLASTRSFLSLDAEHIDLLKLFARLTPSRDFFPKTPNGSANSTQIVSWENLSPLSHHECFVTEARLMLIQAESYHAFQATSKLKHKIDARGAIELRDRAAIRNAFYRIDTFGAEDFTSSNDSIYAEARDGVPNSLYEHEACFVSTLVDTWSRRLDPQTNLFQQMQTWGTVFYGPQPNFDYSFDKRWLQHPQSFMPQQWCSLQFDLAKGFEPDKTRIRAFIDACKVPFDASPDRLIARVPHEHEEDLAYRRLTSYQAATKREVGNCLEALMQQWPSKAVSRPRTLEIETYLPGLKSRFGEIQSMFEMWHRNLEFQTYVQNVQDVLDSLPRPEEMPDHYFIPPQEDVYQTKRAYFRIDDLLQIPAPDLPVPKDNLEDFIRVTDQVQLGEADKGPSKLKSLLSKLSRSATGFYQVSYVKDLRKSHNAFLATPSAKHEFTAASPYEELKHHLEQCQEHADSLFARQSSMLPRLSPSILLRLLARFNPVTLSAEWKLAIIRYALAIASLQRAQRVVACGNRDADILAELANSGHTNWDPEECPEWLLLELENNLLIRPEQAQIAREMIEPQSGSNSIMQLNMGLGKSSVIVPMVAATLADRSKLVRVVVLKSLSEQMFQLLVSKLGGLIGRRIYRLPISRSLKPTLQSAELILKTFEECMSCGGVLLVQPESLLSFELLGIDYLLSRELNAPKPETNPSPEDSLALSLANYETGKFMVNTQQWLYQHARDILDESDEILSVKYELIYTLGLQQNVQFSPDRWVIIQRVLGVLGETSQEMMEEFPKGLEIMTGSAGSFPRIRILHEDVGKILLQRVAKAICRSGMVSFPTWTFSEKEREVVLEYITDLQISKPRAAILEDKVFKTQFTKMSLLLLRGLFAAGVLEFVFAKKRWRVNYGLDPSRSMLAVPYHAKDNPSPRSEFSHPDTAIALTCLSYYYGGLTDEQIHDSFEELLLSDQSQEEYVRWIQYSEDFPKKFKRLAGVNLRDKHQCTQELFPSLRHSKGLIDYYLEHLVFPKEMKEFSNKLSSSGWEIAREKAHPTTSFSGTNDSKYMLPIPIKQCELPEQLSTNAEVLACLLQPENIYDTVYAPRVEALDAAALLDIAVNMDPPIRVLLDVGAQLLEDNERIASNWLEKVSPDYTQAVVFIHDDDIYVLNREGMKEPLLISPFAKQLDQVLIYLDEAPTRGIDIKMPSDYRAIVTLGPDLTKDRLAQACKRLRKLGHGQSVVFCAPLEVRSKLLECSGKKDASLLDVEDVLFWTMRNSWEFTKKGMPLWATQGIRHYRRRAACDYSGMVPRIPIGILEPEALTLEERYGLDRVSADEGIVCRNRIQAETDLTRTELSSIRVKCREFGLHSFGDADLHEEQERELHPENEREQQVEAPPPTKPYKHVLHEDIRQLVLTGKLASRDGVEKAFRVFDLTRARERLNADEWPDNLLMSHDFAATVLVPEIYNEGNKDSFLRPVNWILSFKGPNRQEQYLVMSPFEVQELLPYMRGQSRVRLHVYTPRLSLSNRSLEDLSFCATPPVRGDWTVPTISTALNLFAGQLYLRDEDEYQRVCRFLGLRFEWPYRGVEVSTDGFISPETRILQDNETAAICKFAQSPVDFLRLVTSFRRLGHTFTNSHMGQMLSGELVPLEEVDDPMDVDESAPEAASATVIKIKRERR